VVLPAWRQTGLWVGFYSSLILAFTFKN